MSYFDDRSLFPDDYINEFPEGYFDSLEYKTQLNLNRILKTEEFKKHALKFVNYIPRDFTIQVSELNGKINAYSFSVVHYGYEDSYNNGTNSFSDLSDFYNLDDDPEISDELKNATKDYLMNYQPDIWNLIKDANQC